MKQQPNPLVPQGTFESQARGKSHVRIAVFTILAIHVVVLGALLIQGCKRDTEDTTANPVPTNDFSNIPPFGSTNDIVTMPAGSNTAPMPPFASETPASSNFGMAPAGTTSAPAGITPFVPSAGAVNNVTEAAPATEYVIVKGDTFGTLATKYGVSVKSIQSANPNLNPTRLKIGEKVKVPAKAAGATSSSSGNSAFVSGGRGTGIETYAVKSGDTLGKIAKSHGTTIKEVQRLNNLQTTQIRVGQKLKLPSRAPATPNPVSPGGTAPVGFPPAGVPAPAQ